jgi:hypothetical protein
LIADRAPRLKAGVGRHGSPITILEIGEIMTTAFLIALLILQASAYPSHPPPSVQLKPEWKYVVTSEDDNQTWKTYYDAASIDHRSAAMVRVWLKQVPITKTEADRQRFITSIIQNRKLNKMCVNGYTRFAYSLTLLEFDCAEKQGRSISIKDYDRAERLLGSDTIEGVPFAPVLKGSMSGFVLEAACK